jgi:hypothetical protein
MQHVSAASNQCCAMQQEKQLLAGICLPPKKEARALQPAASLLRNALQVI